MRVAKKLTPDLFLRCVIYLLVLFTVTTALANPAWTWQIQRIDSIGNVGEYTSLAFDTSGKPYISYYDASNNNLKLAYWTGLNWNISVIDTTGDVGMCSSLIIDSANQKSVTYYDATNGALKYAGYLQFPWSWNVQTVDASGDVGQYTSLAFDVLGNPSIAYYNSTTVDLKSAYWTGSSWIKDVIDTTGDVGMYSSLVIDSANQKSVTYYDATNGALKYAGYLQFPWSWDVQTVDADGDVGQYTSLALDTANYPHISYYDAGSRNLKFAYHDDVQWNTETADTTGDVGEYNSLVLGANYGEINKSYPAMSRGISYYDADSSVIRFVFAGMYDAAVLSILSPESIVHFDTIMYPTVIVRNYGTKAIAIPVTLTIGDYSETLSVFLESSKESTVVFPQWHANIAGTFLLKCTTLLNGDCYAENNVKYKTVIVTSGVGPVIYNITPNHGGDIGFVTVDIYGANFDSGAVAKLTRMGQDIISDSMADYIDSTHIVASFDLRQKQRGSWNVVIMNPSGDSSVFYSGFTIEIGNERLWVDIVGPNLLRGGSQNMCFVTLGNSSNFDICDALVRIIAPIGIEFNIVSPQLQICYGEGTW